MAPSDTPATPATRTLNVEPTVVQDDVQPTDVSTWNAIIRYRKSIGYVVITTVSPLMFGFDNIIVGVVTGLPFFQMTYGQSIGEAYILPALWLGLWNAFVQLGIMLGASLNSSLIEKYGRRVGFSTGGVIGTAAVAAIYASDRVASLNGRRGIFLLGKTILGIALGVLLSTSQTYVSEVSPTRLRGPLLGTYNFFMSIGQLIAITIIFTRFAIFNPSSYQVPFAAQWAFSGFAVIIGFVVPESPAYLVRMGRIQEAAIAWGRLHSGPLADAEFASLEASVVRESAMSREEVDKSASIWQCFRGSNARRTRIIVWANLLQQLLGVTLISNGTYFLQLAGMSAQLSLTITQIGIACNLVAFALSWYSINALGRRFIMLWSTGIVGVLWLSIGIAGCFQSQSTALWYIGIGLMVLSFALSSGVGAAWPVVSAETSSMRLRSQSQTVAWIANAFFSWLFNFFVPYLFNTDEANLGGKIGFIFAGLCTFGFLIIFFEIPEMKGLSYIEIDYMFEQNLPTRKFKTHCQSRNLSQADIKMEETIELSHKE